jgi:hypothetical protein
MPNDVKRLENPILCKLEAILRPIEHSSKWKKIFIPKRTKATHGIVNFYSTVVETLLDVNDY